VFDEAAQAAVSLESQFRAEEEGRVAAVLWDGQSPVGDLTPEAIRAADPGMDAAYLITVDGRLSVLQTHAPFVEGIAPMTTEEAVAASRVHAQRVVDELVGARMVQAAREAVNA